MKKLCVFFTVILILVGLSIPVFADEGFPDAAAESRLRLSVYPYGSEGEAVSVLELPGYPEDPFYLFLPADCGRGMLFTVFEAEWMRINGKTLVSGEYTDAFAEGGKAAVETPNGSFMLNIVCSEELPAVFIHTETGSLNAVHADRTYKESAFLSVYENGKNSLQNAELTYIKGRGNTSWKANEKKSYNIKIAKKTDLFGLGAAKKWVLTSNNVDKTLMRNAIAYTAAKYTRLPNTVDFIFVDLYVNGIYRGNYMLCEKIEIGDNRIGIHDLEADNKALNPDSPLSEAIQIKETVNGSRISWYAFAEEPNDISGGYLLEYDYPNQFDTEPCAFITPNGQCLIVHSPEYASKNEMLYISSLYAEFEEALLSKSGKNKKGKSFTDYIDTDSFIDALLLYEFTEDADRGHTSWYLFVPSGETKFYMGPVWDFDIGMEIADETLRCISSFANASVYGIGKTDDITFIDLLCSHQPILQAMAERFPALAAAFSTELNDQITTLFTQIEASAKADRLRWGYSAEESSDRQLSSYIVKRTEHMRSDFNELNALTDQRIKKGLEEKRLSLLHSATVPICILAAAGAGIAVLIIAKKTSRKKDRRTH